MINVLAMMRYSRDYMEVNGKASPRNQTQNSRKKRRDFIFKALSYKVWGNNYLWFIQSLAKWELYNLLVQSDNLDHLFPCLYGNVTFLRHLDQVSALVLVFLWFHTIDRKTVKATSGPLRKRLRTLWIIYFWYL